MTLTETEIRKLKVADLKTELAALGLSQTGKKDELVQRLLDHFQSKQSPTKSTPVASATGAVPAVGTTAAATKVPGTTSLSPVKTTSQNAAPVQTHKSSTKPTQPTGGATSPSKQPTPASIENSHDVSKIKAGGTLVESHKLSEEDIKNITEELERRKKRCERFGTELSEKDKRLERALRFGEMVEVHTIIRGTKPTQQGKANADLKTSVKGTEAKTQNSKKREREEGGQGNNRNQPQNQKQKQPPAQSGNKLGALAAFDAETLKRRMERFGTVNSNLSQAIVSKEEQDKRDKRMQRFNGETPSTNQA